MQKDFGKIGFILAALGSSIGLGHIWRFPSATGTNGGSAFVLLFIGISLIVGISMLIAEMLIGQYGRKNVVDSFKEIKQNDKTPWRFMGLTLFAGPVILTFYCAVLGWVLYYLVFVSFHLPTDFTQSQLIFETFTGSTKQLPYEILCFAIILFVTAYSVVHGIKGIERLNYILMPLLFIIFFSLMVYAITLPSFSQSFNFMFKPNFSKITSNVVVDAIGQVFFSLSLGAGTIITYASHVDKKQNLLSSSLYILFPGILISLVAGLMIFTFIFEYGDTSHVTIGPGLIFVILPVMFGHFGTLGIVISVLFMIGLLFAGISSTVSLLEPCVKYLDDKLHYGRTKISYGIAFIIFLVGILIILSLNADVKQYLTFFKKDLFSLIADFSANIMLTFGSFFASIFVGYFIPKEALKQWTANYFTEKVFNYWYFSLRVFAPITIAIIFVSICLKFL